MSATLPRITLPEGAPSFWRSVARAFSEAMTAIETRFARTALRQYIDVHAPAASDSAFPVYHTLGRVPAMFTAQGEQALNCYATPADRGEWTASLIKIRCNVSNAALRVKVEV